MIKKIVFITLILILAAYTFNSSSAYAARRVALVIGNSDYKSSPLKNPVNDALDMQRVLKQVGFDVILRTNANYGEMLKAIDEFAEKLKHSQVGLFFYAGHGMQIKGDNYLIPTKAHITSETDVEYSAVNAGRVLGKMESAGNPMNIVILDACRDNPFKRSFRTSQKGLARMDAPVGSILAYATAPGSVAAAAGSTGLLSSAVLLGAGSSPSIRAATRGSGSVLPKSGSSRALKVPAIQLLVRCDMNEFEIGIFL